MDKIKKREQETDNRQVIEQELGPQKWGALSLLLGRQHLERSLC